MSSLPNPSLFILLDNRFPARFHALLRREVRARTTTPDDGGVRRFPLLASLPALGKDTRRAARVPATGGPALASTHWVTDRVHGSAAVMRPPAQPACAP